MKLHRLYAITACAIIALLVAATPPYAADRTIIDEWASIKTPPPPPLASVVTIEPSKTALLMLDFNKLTCNAERRPRCLTTIPAVTKVLNAMRAAKVQVIHSLSPGAAAADILPSVSPLPGEPIVTSGPDKFLGTNLEQLLMEKKIATVIVLGTAAHGAVLYTASGAALRGINTIVPVDGMSAEDLFAEQYVVWHLKNAPRVSGKTVLTKMESMTFSK